MRVTLGPTSKSVLIEAEHTGDSGGTGPTTSTILAPAIVVESMRNIAANAEPRSTRAGGADLGAQRSGSGELVAKAIDKVGADGAVTVEQGEG